MLSISEPDNCCSIEDQLIFIKNIINKEDKIIIIGQTFLNQSNFYATPKYSDNGIYLVNNLSPLLSCFADKISYKCLKLDFGFRFQPVEISFEIVSLIQLNKYMHIQNLFFSENNLSVFIAYVDII